MPSTNETDFFWGGGGKLTGAFNSQYWLQLVLGPTAASHLPTGEGGSKDRSVHNLGSLDWMRNPNPEGKLSKG